MCIRDSYYSGLSSSMVEAIQQAEIDQVEAKYDVLIPVSYTHLDVYKRQAPDSSAKNGFLSFWA